MKSMPERVPMKLVKMVDEVLMEQGGTLDNGKEHPDSIGRLVEDMKHKELLTEISRSTLTKEMFDSSTKLVDSETPTLPTHANPSAGRLASASDEQVSTGEATLKVGLSGETLTASSLLANSSEALSLLKLLSFKGELLERMESEPIHKLLSEIAALGLHDCLTPLIANASSYQV